MMTQTTAAAAGLQKILDAWFDAWNANDLDRVMTFFAENAVYRPGDGSEHRGKAAIRRAFEPQFRGALGTMRFDEVDRLVDEVSRKVATRWICRHDASGFRAHSTSEWVKRIAVGLTVGDRFGWEGLDVLHFDEAGKVIGKFSYGSFRHHPLLLKQLGVPLPARA